MTVEQWDAVVGFVLPLLVSLINRPEWKSWVKATVALTASVAGGTVTALLAGEFTGSSWISSIGIVFASSQAFYHLWFKNSGITSWIEESVRLFFGKKSTDPVEDGTPGDSR